MGSVEVSGSQHCGRGLAVCDVPSAPHPWPLAFPGLLFLCSHSVVSFSVQEDRNNETSRERWCKQAASFGNLEGAWTTEAWDPYQGDASDVVTRLPGYLRLSTATRRATADKKQVPPPSLQAVTGFASSEWLLDWIRNRRLAPPAKITTYLVTTGFLKELLQMKHLKGMSSSSLLTS